MTIRRTAFALLVLLGILGAWLSYQQTVAASDYRQDPRNPRTLQERFLRPRGSIVTADGVVVAESRPAGSQYLRVYPEAGRYAHTVGYSSLVFGDTGIEATRGADLTSEDDGSLRALIIEALGGSLAPHDVRLTLRDDLQQVAFAALGDQVGAVVALDPATGAVLALAASPTFDPNTLVGPGALEVGEALEADPRRPLIDRTRSEFYAPGSTFKLIVTSAGLGSGFVTPETRLPDTDVLELPGSTATIVNADGGFCGDGDTVTLERALIVSCNTAFAELGMQLGSGALLDASEEAGFNGSIPFDLPVVEGGEMLVVLGGLHDDLVRADPVHPVVHPETRLVEVAFDAEGGELVGDDSHPPSTAVSLAARVSEGHDLGWSHAFIARAEGAVCRALLLPAGRMGGEVTGALRPFARDNNPLACDGVAS